MVACVLLDGCETWSLILREEQGIKLCQNKVLRRISGSKRDEVTGGWTKFRNEELHKCTLRKNVITTIKSRGMR
jgi:hypothetical protein